MCVGLTKFPLVGVVLNNHGSHDGINLAAGSGLASTMTMRARSSEPDTKAVRWR